MRRNTRRYCALRPKIEVLRMTVPPVGLRVRISISDPWDFYSENGPFATGRIVSVRDEAAGRSEFKIELDAPLREKQLVANEVFVRLRLVDTPAERFLSGE
jgi:hypothetical protein